MHDRDREELREKERGEREKHTDRWTERELVGVGDAVQEKRAEAGRYICEPSQRKEEERNR